MKIRTLLTYALWMLLAVGLAACDSPPPGPQDPFVEPPPGAASFSFRLSSFDTEIAGTSGTLGGSSRMGTPIPITGELLVVSHGGGQSRVYTIELEIDPDSVQVLTVYNLDLPSGPYDFFFLLKSPHTRFGGTLRNRYIVADVANNVSLTLDPIIGVLIDSVNQLSGLTPFAVRYDPEEMADYAHPRIGVSIDGGAELLFDVVLDAQYPVILLFLQPGVHQIDVRFFDGAIVKDVSVDQPVELPPPPPPGESSGQEPVQEVSLVVPTTVVKYSYVQDPGGTSGTATLHVAIPDEVVEEVGGSDAQAGLPIANRLLVHATVVDSSNSVWEGDLQLTAVMDDSNVFSHYTSEIGLAGFVPGALTWSLTFTALDGTGGMIGYCADSVADTRTANSDDSDSATLSCRLVLLDRAKLGQFPVAQVVVSVQDNSALPLGGAVVNAVKLDANNNPVGDEAPLGVTNTAQGQLSIFLAPARYRFRALYSGAESSAPFDGNVAATGSPVTIPLTVPFNPPDLTPPGLVTGLTATAGDGQVTLHWTPPSDTDLQAVRILRKVGSAPAHRDDGDIVIETLDVGIIDSGLVNGTHYYYAAYARDTSNNWTETAPTADATPVAVVAGTIDLTAALRRQPTRHLDDGYDVPDGTSIRVRIPQLGKPAGSEGDPNVPGVEVDEGNPNRFLLRLRLGRVTCFYLGGSFDRHIEGTEIEDFFRQGFSSPLCYPSNLGAGDVVTVRASHRGHDDDDDDRHHRHHNYDEINARVIVADRHETLTQIGVTIEVVEP